MTRLNLKKEITIFLSLFFGISLFLFWLLNGGAYAKELRYNLFLNSPFAREDLKKGEIVKLANSKTQIANSFENKNNFEIEIPKINVKAPVVFPKTDTIKDILTSLEYGVGLYPGSKLPGEEGRGVILGHSSRASWYRGDYATIFALLPKLEPGDNFFITYKGKKYEYTVLSKQYLTPEETNAILAGPSSGSEIDLITCWPIGSASKRTLIRGKLTTNN